MSDITNKYFDTEVAKDVGVDAAIIFQNITFWIHKNMTQQAGREKQPSFQEGRWWTYNSRAAFAVQFPWLSDGQIRVCLDKLKKKDYIKTGNFNKNAYDRTKWYSLGENEIATRLIGEMNQSIGEMNQSIGAQHQSIGAPRQPIPNENTNYNRERATLRLSEGKRYEYEKFSFMDQLKLLRSIMTINDLDDVKLSALLDRLNKTNHTDKLKTAYQWLYTDVIDGKLSALYFDFRDSGGGVVNHMPPSFEAAKELMQKRIEELEKKTPGFIKSKQVEVPEYDV